MSEVSQVSLNSAAIEHLVREIVSKSQNLSAEKIAAVISELGPNENIFDPKVFGDFYKTDPEAAKALLGQRQEMEMAKHKILVERLGDIIDHHLNAQKHGTSPADRMTNPRVVFVLMAPALLGAGCAFGGHAEAGVVLALLTYAALFLLARFNEASVERLRKLF